MLSSTGNSDVDRFCFNSKKCKIALCVRNVKKAYTLCSEKNTHSHFVSYLHELFADLNKNCSEYAQGLTDSDSVKIRYSLRSMT